MTLPWRLGAGSLGPMLALMPEGAGDEDADGEARDEALWHELQPPMKAAPSATTRGAKGRLFLVLRRIACCISPWPPGRKPEGPRKTPRSSTRGLTGPSVLRLLVRSR